MTVRACAVCLHLYVISSTDSSASRCPRCQEPLRLVRREDVVSHLRQDRARRQGPSSPAVKARFRVTVRTRRRALRIPFAAVGTPQVRQPSNPMRQRSPQPICSDCDAFVGARDERRAR